MENNAGAYEQIIQEDQHYEAPHNIVDEVIVSNEDFVLHLSTDQDVENISSLKGTQADNSSSYQSFQNEVEMNNLDNGPNGVVDEDKGGCENNYSLPQNNSLDYIQGMVSGDEEILCSQMSDHYAKEVVKDEEKVTEPEETKEEDKTQLPAQNSFNNVADEMLELGEISERNEHDTSIDSADGDGLDNEISKMESIIGETDVEDKKTEKPRNVIQEIFDDWQDENTEEENNMAEKEQDSVEMELQNLLNDNSHEQRYNSCNTVPKVKEVSCVQAKQSDLKNNSLDKSIPSFVPPHLLGRNVKNPLQDQPGFKQKLQSPRPGVQVPGLHLTSQIASTAEVKDLLTEKLKEKQKDIVAPKAMDSLFIKKISQRLSSKLSSVKPANIIKPIEEVPPVPSSNAADNTDLLAILEGDADPDWSCLTSKEDSTPSVKEIALKQLQELPTSPNAKKVGKAKPDKEKEKETGSPKTPEKEDKSASDTRHSFLREEESRSGRKRKLTEKFRDIEQQTLIKRQKKVDKKPDSESKPEISSPKSKKEETVEDESKSVEGETTPAKPTPNKQSKLGISKKDTPISKKKASVKNLIRQKIVSKKLKTSPPNSKPKTKNRKTNEIDKLLQDEGVVNMLYDTEQVDGAKRRLVPITKTHKTTMDMDKIEREWKARNKLVKNALMRARNSSLSPAMSTSRSRRSATQPETNEKKSETTIKSPKVSISESTTSSEFIMPGKIRNAADASRIIRRHSSSSFSSASASPRVSIDTPFDQANNKTDETELEVHIRSKVLEKALAKKTKRKSGSETDDSSVKSQNKKEGKKKNVVKVENSSANTTSPAIKGRKVTKNKSTTSNSSTGDVKDENEEATSSSESTTTVQAAGASRANNPNRKKGSGVAVKDDETFNVDLKKMFTGTEFKVTRIGHLVQLTLIPSESVSELRNTLTVKVMKEMQEVLELLEKDSECKVVLFTTTGTTFCDGLELSSLLQSSKEEQKAKAIDLANGVKNFLKALANFKKPIVAGVQGIVRGLGITMLPLFDLVIASDKATFNPNHGKLGQIAEGSACLTLSSYGRSTINELLIANKVLSANEALRAGIVTRVLWPDKFQGELLPMVKAVSEQSSQSMLATKTLLRKNLRKNLDVDLEAEAQILIEQWCTPECQQLIKAYLDEKDG